MSIYDTYIEGLTNLFREKGCTISDICRNIGTDEIIESFSMKTGRYNYLVDVLYSGNNVKEIAVNFSDEYKHLDNPTKLKDAVIDTTKEIYEYILKENC
ncbi:MAG: hypothetical protein ABIG84_06875 [archaeon]